MKKADTVNSERMEYCTDGQKGSKLVIVHTYTTFYDYRSGLSDFSFYFIFYLHLYYYSVEPERSSKLVVIKFVAFIQT